MASFPSLLTLLGIFVGFVGACHQIDYSWSCLEFAYDTEEECAAALADGSYVPEYVIPTGINVQTETRVFLSIPRRTLTGEVRAKKPSLTLNLGINGLKVTFEPPPMAGQAGRLQGQDRSAVTYPSSSHARRWYSFSTKEFVVLLVVLQLHYVA
ncbi:hypothetical protein J6590_072916 [Homalodisca vitripennis]|nr:hypothetical protein J6590_072916 [Homalodisca vitripennis]